MTKTVSGEAADMADGEHPTLEMNPEAAELPVRIGTARLTKAVFDGGDVNDLWADLRVKFATSQNDIGALMDMSVVAQLAGLRDQGLKIQKDALSIGRLYRTPCSGKEPRVRLLVLAGAFDMGANTPVEFLLENEDADLCTLYILPEQPIYGLLPLHDVALIAVPDSDEAKATLDDIEDLLPDLPRPVLNKPENIRKLYRSDLYRHVADIEGVFMPKTVNATRAQLEDIASGKAALSSVLDAGDYPLIIRPHDSHAGRGLAKIGAPAALTAYLHKQPETEFFLSSFIDYSSKDDGLFRKYRIAFIDGKPYGCHMAISKQWDIWYLNAHMAASQNKLAEEEKFLTRFDETFGKKHEKAMAELAKALGLEYFAIDCAETKDGELFIFEGSNTMIVHNMDSPEVYPYKGPQMKKIFAAFTDMLEKYGKKDAAAQK